MAFTSTHKTRVQNGFETLFKTLHTHDKHVGRAQEIIDQAFNELEQAKGVYERQLAKNEGWWKNRGHIAAYEATAKETLTSMVDALAELPTSGGKPRTPAENAQIAALRDSLSTLVDKENVAFAKDELTKNADTQMGKVHARKEKAREHLSVLQDNVPKLSQLAPSGREMPLTEPYYQEYLFDLHLPMAHGAGTELISALDTAFSTGKPPEHFKQFRSSVPGRNLYETMADTLSASHGDKRVFFEAMKEAFKASPDIPADMITKNFKSVAYLGPEQREALKLTIRDGQVYQNGRVFDTSGVVSKNVRGEVAFVITASGEMLASPHVGGEFHHSSFMSGERVVAAGMMKVTNGKIEMINNNSGHYKPQEHNMVQGLRSVPNLSSAFAADGRVAVAYSTQAAPESFPDFLDRAAPLAEARWEKIEAQQQAYAAKHLQLEKPRLGAIVGVENVVDKLRSSGVRAVGEVNDNIKAEPVSAAKQTSAGKGIV